jgi:hypothetical protein
LLACRGGGNRSSRLPILLEQAVIQNKTRADKSPDYNNYLDNKFVVHPFE